MKKFKPLLSSHLFLVQFLSLNLHFLLCHSIDKQGQALLSWKNSLNNSTEALNSWNPSQSSPCNNNWFGVHCNTNGQVIKLSLESLDLQGSLPFNLHQLKAFTTLVLSSTNLTSSNPTAFGEYSELCNLRKLQTLYLNTNFLEGQISAGIGKLSRLASLTLYDNELAGEILRSFGELRELD